MNNTPEWFNKFDKGVSWLNGGTFLLVRHGSHAYGTNTPTSDEDFKGVAVPPERYFTGFSHRFEQAELRDPDTCIYDVRKFFNLAAACNPNIIEVLHVTDEEVVMADARGRLLLQHRYAFLSRRARYTFMGYAVSQLKRIKTHRKWLLNPPKTPPTRASLGLPEHTVIPEDQLKAAHAEIGKELDRLNLLEVLDDQPEPVKIGIREAVATMLAQMRIHGDEQWQAAGRRIGLDENFLEVMKKERALTQALTEWKQFHNWETQRNRDRHELEAKYGYDTKHAYHLVRLIRMCREILEKGRVIVKRPDAEELLSIRNGAWEYDRLVEFAEREDAAMQAAYDQSPLPRTPNLDALDELCQEIVAMGARP